MWALKVSIVGAGRVCVDSRSDGRAPRWGKSGNWGCGGGKGGC